MRLKIVPHRLPTRTVAILFLAMMVLAAGCSLLPGQASDVTETPEQTRTAAVFPTVTPEPLPTALPTATPEPTPISPMIQVSAQEVGEDGVLLIDEASSAGGGLVGGV